MSDSDSTIDALKKKVEQFVKERDWEQFHSPKNLSMSIAIEAAELMEHFQWCSLEESKAFIDDPVKLREIKNELADITSYILSFCNLYGIDLTTALSEKMIQNAKKYPAEKVKNGVIEL